MATAPPVAVELCTLLVEEVYGQLYGRIFSTLLNNGRVDIGTVLRHTDLTIKQIRTVLSVLVEHRLVFHHAASSHSPTFYEANWKNAYSLARSGKIVQYTVERFGEIAGLIISILIRRGGCRIDDLRAEVGSSRPSDATLMNGTQENHNYPKITDGGAVETASDSDDFDRILENLSRLGFICRVRPKSFHTVADNRAQLEAWAESNRNDLFPGPQGKQLKSDKERLIAKTLEEWYDTRIHCPEPEPVNGIGGNNRKRAREEIDSVGSHKRGKLQNGTAALKDPSSESTGHHQDGVLGDNLPVCVNYDKYLVAFRNTRLVSQSEQTIGSTSSRVYEALLTQAERKLHRCQINRDINPDDEIPDPVVFLSQVQHVLNPNLDLRGSIGSPDPTTLGQNGVTKNRKRQQKTYTDEDEALVIGSASSDEDDTPGSASGTMIDDPLSYTPSTSRNPLVQHLLLLSDSPPFRFCEPLDAGNRWSIPYNFLSLSLLHSLLLNVITTRFGTASARLTRILLTSQPDILTLKLSETQLTQMSLLSTRTVRSSLARMTAAHFLGLQEVPRDSQRQPSRTTYLYFFDPERVKCVLEMECYQTMARLIQRLRVERDKKVSVLDKCEREDVKGREEQFLAPSEKEALREWKAIERMIWGQVGRLDDMVMVLRDF